MSVSDAKKSEGFKECVILHVDDDMPELTVFQRALLSKGFTGTYRRVRSIEAAKDYLQRKGSYSDPALFPLPEIIVTDLWIRGDSGVNLIRWIRRKKKYRKTPIVAFSACKDVDARQRSISAGGIFIEKRSDYAGLVSKVREIMNHCPVENASPVSCLVALLDFACPYVGKVFELSRELSESAI